jgi:hypothetical protein
MLWPTILHLSELFEGAADPTDESVSIQDHTQSLMDLALETPLAPGGQRGTASRLLPALVT